MSSIYTNTKAMALLPILAASMMYPSHRHYHDDTPRSPKKCALPGCDKPRNNGICCSAEHRILLRKMNKSA